MTTAVHQIRLTATGRLEVAIAGQQKFAELHAKFWPECEMVATLRQISAALPEAADG